MSKYPIRLMRQIKAYCENQAICNDCPIYSTCNNQPRNWTVIEERKKSREEYQHDYYMTVTKQKRAEKRNKNK